MTKTHRHSVAQEETQPFSGPVADRQNPAAHGNVCYIQHCKCGATRKTNVNGANVERGRWEPLR